MADESLTRGLAVILAYVPTLLASLGADAETVARLAASLSLVMAG